MNRTIRTASRAIAVLLSTSLAAPAFACADVTFSFVNTQGTLIRVNQVRVVNAATGVQTIFSVFKNCPDGFPCVTPAINLAPAVNVGDNISGVRYRYQEWTGAGWSGNYLSPVYAPTLPVCATHRDYGTYPI
jgi:hypothetical protein